MIEPLKEAQSKALKQLISEYNNIKEQIDLLERKKEQIRRVIKKWYDEEYGDKEGKIIVSLDNDVFYRIQKTRATVRKVKNYEVLKSILGDKYNDIISENKIDRFTLAVVHKRPDLDNPKEREEYLDIID